MNDFNHISDLLISEYKLEMESFDLHISFLISNIVNT